MRGYVLHVSFVMHHSRDRFNRFDAGIKYFKLGRLVCLAGHVINCIVHVQPFPQPFPPVHSLLLRLNQGHLFLREYLRRRDILRLGLVPKACISDVILEPFRHRSVKPYKLNLLRCQQFGLREFSVEIAGTVRR
ncbi:hypothetical protein D3C74_338210 [compost metagenome]